MKKQKTSQFFSKKTVLLIALCVIIALSLVTILIIINNKSKKEEYVTRAEWITMLGENFALTTFEQPDPYYVDVPSSHSAFTYVQASYEWDILRDAKKFEPDKAATRGFVAQTAVLAAMPIYDSSYADMDDDELFQFAFENGIISSDVAKDYVTKEECAKIIENITQYYLSLVPEEYANIKLKDGVIDYSTSVNIRVDGDTVYFYGNAGQELKVGTIFIAPGEVYGVAKKVTSVNQIDGQIVVTTKEPEIDEVFDELNFYFVGRPSYEDIVPLHEGVTISPLSDTDSSNSVSTRAGMIYLSNTSPLGNIPINLPSFSVKLNITKGKLTHDMAFTDYFSVGVEETYNELFGCEIPEENGELFKETKTTIVKDKEGNVVVDKIEEWKGGYEIFGEIKVKDVYVEISYEDNLKSLAGKVHFTVDSSLKFVGKLEGSVPIYETVIPGPWGVWVKVVFSVYVDCNGEIAVGAEIEHTSSVSYQDKKFKTTHDTDYVSSVAKRSSDVSSGIKGELIPTALGIELFDVTAKAGAGIEIDTAIHHSEQAAMICIGGTLYYPEVSLSVGANSKTLANKLGVKATLKLVGKSGALIKSAPKTLWHFEITGNGFTSVKKCTWETVIAKPKTESKSESNKTQHSVKTEATTTPFVPNQTETTQTTENTDLSLNATGSVGLEYEINSDGKTCSITGIGTYNDSNVVIPEVIDGYKVTAIADIAFDRCTTIKEIIIPKTVTSIGFYAFSHCTSLTSITIPNSVTSIGTSAFVGCTSLTSITIPNSVTSISNKVFSYCTSLTSVTIGKGVTNFGEMVFYRCTSLTNITIPDSVTSIGEGAFDGCTSLTSITIPNSVTYIGVSAFSDCTSLTSIIIPDSVTQIDHHAFHGCTGLKDVYYTGTEAEWKAISKGSYNDPLTNATIHFNSKN